MEESPLCISISFQYLLDTYLPFLSDKKHPKYARAQTVWQVAKLQPVLVDGFSDLSLLETYKAEIQLLLADIFPENLTDNEIKAATIPFQNFIFHPSRRLQRIMDVVGPDYIPKIRNLPDGQIYIMACVVILKSVYGAKLDFRRPVYFDIPDQHGLLRTYRVLYNADFVEILPTKNAKELRQKDIDQLMDNFHDLALWKEKIPPDSYTCKGFALANMYDATLDTSISDLKSNLLANEEDENYAKNYRTIFQSLFEIPDIDVGYVAYDADIKRFEKIPIPQSRSFLLGSRYSENWEKVLCMKSYQTLIENFSYFTISDVDQAYKSNPQLEYLNTFKEQGIKSVILAPIALENQLLGVMELVSFKARELNSVNAQKLNEVMPYMVSATDRALKEQKSRIQVLIQQKCTSIHPTVYWKFEEEAKRFLGIQAEGGSASFKEMVFSNVYPLYGQTDIRESSTQRNLAIQRDLLIQLSEAQDLLLAIQQYRSLPIIDELLFRIKELQDRLGQELQSHLEQLIGLFIIKEVHPILDYYKNIIPNLKGLISEYESKLDSETRTIYDHRRNYDQSVTLINKCLAEVIDKQQEQAQAMFPHFFERYKTDGVEHNMYIGQSLVRDRVFDPLFLHNLRLWQLQVICQMENAFYKLEKELPLKLNVASLILVHSQAISIRYRMDEKRFDVDGTYNARYEIIKKRLDKALIKGSRERLTQSGKIVIVFANQAEEEDYLRYVRFLQYKSYLADAIEIVELENLQGVSGLQAIRVDLLYNKEKQSQKYFTYSELMDTLAD